MAGHVERRGIAQHGPAVAQGFQRPHVGHVGLRRHGRRRHHQHVAPLEHALVRRGQGAPLVLGLGVQPAVVGVVEIAADQGHELHLMRQVLGLRLERLAQGRNEAFVVQPLPVVADAVAVHQRGHALGDQGPRNAAGLQVRGNRHLFHLAAQVLDRLHGLADLGVHLRLRHGSSEPFLEDAEPHPFDAFVQALRICLDRHVVLPRVQRVLTGDDFEQQRSVFHAAAHRAGVVERVVDPDDAGVRHQAVRRLVPDHAAPRGRNADRAPLIPADGHIDIVVRQRRARTPRRSAGQMIRVVRIARRAVGAGMAAAGEGEVVHVEDRADRASGVQDARDDGRVDVRHIAVQHERGARHGHAGDAHVVLDADPFAGQLARRGPAHRTAPDDRVQRIVFRVRSDAGVPLAVRNLRQIAGRLIECVQRGEHVRQHRRVGFGLLPAQFEVAVESQALQVVMGRFA